MAKLKAFRLWLSKNLSKIFYWIGVFASVIAFGLAFSSGIEAIY